MKLFNFKFGEDKGMKCQIDSNEGMVRASCQRTKKIKQNDGTETEVFTGQNVNMHTTPDCNIAYTGDLSVQDDDGFNAFDKIANRLKKSCQRISKQGILPKQ